MVLWINKLTIVDVHLFNMHSETADYYEHGEWQDDPNEAGLQTRSAKIEFPFYSVTFRQSKIKDSGFMDPETGSVVYRAKYLNIGLGMVASSMIPIGLYLWACKAPKRNKKTDDSCPG